MSLPTGQWPRYATAPGSRLVHWLGVAGRFAKVWFSSCCNTTKDNDLKQPKVLSQMRVFHGASTLRQDLPFVFFCITYKIENNIDAKKEHVDLRKAVCGSNMLELEFTMSEQSIDRIEIVVLLLGIDFVRR